MDPLTAVSLAASVGGLVHITCGIATLSYTYFSGVNHADEVQKSCRHEVAALMEVLFQLERALDSADTAALVVSRAAELNQLINECREDLSGIQSTLSQASSNHFTKFIWPIKSKKLKGQIEKIHRLRSIISDFVSSIILVSTSQTHASIRSLTISQERTQLLSSLPSGRDVSLPRPMPCPGTGRWFIDSTQFQTWLGKDCGLLWCYGPPGVGKSLLASAAVKHLLEQQKQRKLYLCHFFCDYLLRDRQTTVAILQSLVYQLIGQADAELLAVARTHLAVLDISSNPENLLKILGTACRSGSNMVVVLDTEDEIKRNEAIVDFLLGLSARGCHVLITSRMVRSFAGDAAKTAMAIDARGADIETYVKHRLQTYNPATAAIDALVPRVVDKSNGLFLLSKLLVDHLMELTTVDKMLRFLSSAPKGLDQVLGATLKRINEQPPAFRHLAHRTLGWVLNAKRPLSTEELLHAFALILRSCAGFVTMDERGTVRLAHASIYTFCYGHMGDNREVENDIARSCIRYLRLRPMSLGSCKSVDELLERSSAMPFLMYAAKNVGNHMAVDLAAEDEIATLMLDLLEDACCRESTWQALVFNIDIRTPAIADDFFRSLPSGPTALHLAAYWNLHAACEQLLSRGHMPSPRDSQQWTPLHWAAANGCEKAATLLLGSGAAIDAQDSEGWTPLFWASFEGHALVVQALLVAGANHLVTGGPSRWTALHWAISRNNMEVVKLLISHDRAAREARAATTSCSISDTSVEDLYDDWDLLDVRSDSSKSQSQPPSADPDALSLGFFDAVAQHLDLSPVAGWRERHSVFMQRTSGMVGCDGDELRAFRPLVSNVAWRTHYKIGTSAMAGREDLVAHRPGQWKEILLQSAIAASNLPAAQLLVELGADVNLRDPDVPFLRSAVTHEDHLFLELLVSNGVEASCVLGDAFHGGSLLHAAVSSRSKATERAVS